MKRVITITSGKGGVGKTNISMNLAAQMAKEGLRTCIFDADMGLANINILLGIMPEYNLADVVSGEKKLTDILVHDPCGVDIVPGGSGVEKLASMTTENLSALISSFSRFEEYDVLLFDTSAGIGRDVISFCMASREVVLILQPEPTSLTDGYSLLKVLAKNGYRYPVKVIINHAKSERYAGIVFTKFKQTVKKFLPLEISYAGSLPADEKVPEAVTRQRPFVTLYPTTPASGAIARLVRHLLAPSQSESSEESFRAFWKKYAAFINKPINLIQKNAGSKPLSEASDTPPKKEPPVENRAPEAVSDRNDTVSCQILDALNQLVSLTKEISATLKESRHSPMEKIQNDADTDSTRNESRTAAPRPFVIHENEAKVAEKRQPALYTVKVKENAPTKIKILPKVMIDEKRERAGLN